MLNNSNRNFSPCNVCDVEGTLMGEKNSNILIDEKNVLILGGSSDIGLELAKKFLDKKNYNIHLHYNSNLKILKKIKCKLIKADLSNSNEKKF